MFIDDPNPTPTDDTAPDPGSAAATPEPAAEVDDGAAMLAAIEAEAAPKQPEPEPEPKPESGEPAAPKAKDEPAPDADLEAEISGLQLKEKAAARFRELTASAKEAAPLREALEKAGIKDVAELPARLERAAAADDMIRMVTETGASADQYGQTLDYLGMVNAAAKGDLKAAEQAYGLLEKELAVMAGLLGREVPGVHDLLAAHPDLLEDIENSDLTRKRALEIAGNRNREALRAKDQERSSQRDSAAQQQQRGRTDLNALGAELAQADPHFQAKLPQLLAFRDAVRETYPVDKWVPELRKLYAIIPNPAPVAAPAAKPTPGPVRATGPMPAMTPAFDDPMKAMMAGIAAATE